MLLSLSGGPLWPLRGPNLSKRVSPAVLFFLSMSVCSFFSLVVRLSLREATASRAAWLSLALQAAVFKEKHGFCPAVLFFLSLAACSFLSQAVRFCALRVRPLRKGLPSCSVHTLMHKCKKVRFERFGSLTDQNGPPEREGSTANKTKNSWGKTRFQGFGPLTGQNGPAEREGSTANKTKNSWGKTRFQGFGPLTGQNGPAEREGSTANTPAKRTTRRQWVGLGVKISTRGPIIN